MQLMKHMVKMRFAEITRLGYLRYPGKRAIIFMDILDRTLQCKRNVHLATVLDLGIDLGAQRIKIRHCPHAVRILLRLRPHHPVKTSPDVLSDVLDLPDADRVEHRRNRLQHPEMNADKPDLRLSRPAVRIL